MRPFASGRIRVLLVALVFLTILFEACAVARVRFPAKNKQEAPSRRPWLMIAMAPDGCSKGCRHVHSVVKSLSGNPRGLVIHFSRVTLGLIQQIRPEFIVLGPQGTPWCRYTGAAGIALQNFLWLLPVCAEEMNVPILGICGGHQALALAFGGRVGPIRAGEFDCMPYTRDRQGGLVPLRVISPDPIFQGTDGSLRILESHFDEVKVLPPGFVLLASEKISRNQIIRHPTRPVYGIQGHPERFNYGRPDGGVLIRNFLRIADVFNQTVRNSQRPEPAVVGN